MFWIVRNKNQDATNFYLAVIQQAIQQNGWDCAMCESAEGCAPQDVLVVATASQVCSLWQRGYRNILLWSQGIWPEESYLRHHSGVRSWMIGLIEKRALLKASALFLVSEGMKKHYQQKYRINISDKCIIMPCFNEVIHPSSFTRQGKYTSNRFVYAGSLCQWQRFDTIASCYKQIEDYLRDTELLVLTKEQERAASILNQIGVKHYRIDYSQVTELHQQLCDCKYGFVLREDIIVNRVATPSKLSSYMANGVIPIYSECLEDFHRATAGFQYKLVYSDDFLSRFLRFNQQAIRAEDVYREYTALYSDYYSKERHVANIAAFLSKCTFKQ